MYSVKEMFTWQFILNKATALMNYQAVSEEKSGKKKKKNEKNKTKKKNNKKTLKCVHVNLVYQG